jgi:peroxiredoxin
MDDNGRRQVFEKGKGEKRMRRANVLATILFVAVIMLVSSTPASADTTALVGKPAPDFSLTTLDGKAAKLSAQRGKVVVICFWNSDVVYARSLLPYIQRLNAQQDWASKGLVVWAITADDPHQTAAVAKKFLKDGNYTIDVPYDNDIVAFTGYQVRIAPTTVVIGSDGIIKNVIIGFGNTVPNQIGAAVERALAESGKLDATALIGNPAPAFLLTTLNQAPMRLDDQKYAHKVMLITFWADDNSSASTLRHIQELAANRNFAGNGLRVLAVATGRRTPGEVRKFLLDNRYTFDVAFDAAFAAWEESLGRETATFVIGRDGTVRNVFAGADVSNSNFDGAVASALEHSDDYAFLIGKPAPDFSLTTLDGKTVKLSDQSGKVVLLDFWATWCYPCQVTLPHTQELSDNRDLANKGLVVWAITQPYGKESLADAKRYVETNKYSFVVPADTQSTVSTAYGVFSIPTMAVVGRNGLIKNFGHLDAKALDDSIASALAESRPPVASNVQPILPSAPARPANPAIPSPAPSNPANPAASSSAPATQPIDPLASIWQSPAQPGQTFRFTLDGDAIYVYGGRQELLGVLDAKRSKGEIEMYEGLVRLAPVAQCPGGRGLMQIKNWNESRLDARIETPVKGPSGITCGGVLGTGRLIRWQQTIFVKR